MDLQELRYCYETAVEQIQVLDAELADLKCRHMNTGNNSNYLEFKITIIQGVIRMYEQYRETKWAQLQKETALALREVLQREAIVPATPLTPPLSPSGTPPPSPTHRVPESPRHVNEMEWADDDEFYLIPAPIAPIRDMDFLPTPPSSPSHYSNSLLTDVPDFRDY